MEALNQSYGYVLYEHIATAASFGLLQPGDRPRDRIIVYVNGTKRGVIDSIYETPAQVELSLGEGDRLQLLVENLRRMDYWSLESGTFNALLEPHKGIVGNVTVGGSVLENWEIHSLPFDQVPNQPAASSKTSRSGRMFDATEDLPVLYKGGFSLNASTNEQLQEAIELDTFLAIPTGTKGVVWVNDFNLGRYWIVGPQQSLYLAGTVVKQGGA